MKELINNISKKITDTIILNTDFEEKDRVKIDYGIKSLLFNLTKIPIMLFVAYLLGVIKLSLITFVLGGLLRQYSGGFHNKTYIGCLLSSIIIYVLTPYFVQNLNVNILLIIISFIISIVSIYLYAPSDTYNKPIVSRTLRKKLKRKSYIIFFVYLIITMLSIYVFKNNVYANIICSINLFNSLHISPILFIITGEENRRNERRTSLEKNIK